MPIYQPAQTTIYARDFRNKAYSFAVESVLGAEVVSPEVLVIEATKGYGLTTSRTNQARQEQSFEYSKQPDSSWVASGMVTLLLNGESPIDGTVTIQNSLAEKVTLAISTASTSIERAQALTVSHSALTFAPTSPGKPSFLILTVAQQHADSPITLTTDAPDYFQLASDRYPNFASSLTLVPSPAGTYIHVRYAANRGGLHTGQLLIDSIDETRTIALTARSTSLLPIVRTSSRQPITGRWAGVLGLIVLGGLSYVSYNNRCQLFPSLCQEMTTNQPVNSSLLPKKIRANDSYSSRKVVKRESIQRPIVEEIKSPVRQSLRNKATERIAEQPSSDIVEEQQKVAQSRTLDRTSSGRKNLADPDLNKSIDKRSRRPTTVAPPTEESELEKTLNQVVPKQL